MADAGLDLRTTIKVPIVPTHDNIWETMIKPVMTAMYPDKKSTTELSTIEMMGLYEQLNALTADRWGISLNWPNSHTGGKC